MSSSPKLALDYLVASQAQKEVTHNHALNDLDALVQPVVISRGLNTAPSSPAEGDAYITGDAPTGVWSGQDKKLAFYYAGWQFKTPRNGWQVFVDAENSMARFDGTNWQICQMQASQSWTPGSIAAGSAVSSSAISVSGAAFGDLVFVAAPYDLLGVMANAYLSSDGNVIIRLFNPSGSAVSLGAGAWKIRIFKG